MFNPAITKTATRGYYVVYLFSADMARLYLTLNQGTTAIEQEFKSRYLSELERRAQLGNARLGKLPPGMSNAAIDLASSGTLPDGYEAGHICGYSYDLGNLPSDAVLTRHLGEILSSYLMLDTLGGLTDLPSADDDDAFEGDSVDERRRYRQHRSIERNPSTSRKVRKPSAMSARAAVSISGRYTARSGTNTSKRIIGSSSAICHQTLWCP